MEKSRDERRAMTLRLEVELLIRLKVLAAQKRISVQELIVSMILNSLDVKPLNVS